MIRISTLIRSNIEVARGLSDVVNIQVYRLFTMSVGNDPFPIFARFRCLLKFFLFQVGYVHGFPPLPWRCQFFHSRFGK